MGEFTEEQEMLRQSIRDVAVSKIAPKAAQYDAKEEYPWEFIELYRELGLFALMIPEEFDGASGSVTSACLVAEELAKVDGSAAMLFVIQAVVPAFIRLAGNQEQKNRYLKAVAQGKLVAEALTEPDAGSDVSSIKTTAVLQGDHYVLNGIKAFCSGAKVADFLITFAMVKGGKGPGGITAFVVDKDTPGLTIGRLEDKLGLRAVPTGEVVFDNAVVPVANRVGEEGQAFNVIWPAMNEARTIDGALATGLAEGALECAINYSKERVQFKKPIGTFEGVQFMLADMATRTEAARCLVYKSAAMLDRGEDATKFASMAKFYASDVAMEVTVDAIQVLGAYGYTKAHPVERMMRDAKAMQIVEGTNQIQRMIIARNLTGKIG